MTQKKVIIADDERQLSSVFALRCQHLGLKVRTASNGTDVLKLIGEDPPDLIFLDVNMPGEDGLSVCETLSSDPQLTSIPVIMLTGQSDDETVAKCKRLGAHFFQKTPDVWDRLTTTICELLDLQPGQSRRSALPEPLVSTTA
jgi:CheY-like chemotaxis protein